MVFQNSFVRKLRWLQPSGRSRRTWGFIIGHYFKERETEEWGEWVTPPMSGEVSLLGLQAMPLTTEPAASTVPRHRAGAGGALPLDLKASPPFLSFRFLTCDREFVACF